MLEVGHWIQKCYYGDVGVIGQWTHSVDVYLASMWSEAKRIHHIPAFFSKTQLSIYWGEKKYKILLPKYKQNETNCSPPFT